MSTPTAQVVSIKLASVKVPEYKEVQGRNGYVLWGGDNCYPDYLIKLFNESAKQSAIVTGKTSYVCGREIQGDTEAAKKFVDNVNPIDSLPVFARKLVLDYELYAGYAYLIVPNMAHDKPATYYHVDFGRLRFSEDGKKIYYHPDWTKVKTGAPKEKDGFKVYDAFDGNYDKPKIAYYMAYRPANGTYPIPEYRGGLMALETDVRVNNFHLNNLRNGFFGSKVFTIKSAMQTPEQQAEMERKISEKFASDDNAGKFLLLFSDGSENAVQIDDLTAGDFGEQFQQLRKDTEQEIFIAHKVPSPMLFGVRVEGQLGGRSELLDAYELFNNTYVEERRQHFEKLFNKLAADKGITGKIEILPFVPMKAMFSEETMLQVLNKDEIRSMMGFEPIDTKVSANATTDAIQSLSPLVANKVLESMTPNEVRGLAALPPKEDGEDIPGTTASQPVAMSIELDDERDSGIVAKYGFDKKDSEVLNYWELKYRNLNDMNAYHLAFDTIAGTEVTEKEKKALKSIQDGKQARIPTKERDALREKHLIEIDRESGSMKLTNLGGLVLTPISSEKKLADYETVYDYVKRPDANGPDILPDGRTRPFCEALIKSDRYYSRNDITAMSAELGYDVWTHRGGWMTMPNGNHRPSCRHIWRSVLVKKK